MSEGDTLKWRINRVHDNRCALLPEFDCGKLNKKEGLQVELYTQKGKPQVGLHDHPSEYSLSVVFYSLRYGRICN